MNSTLLTILPQKNILKSLSARTVGSR